MIKKYHFELGLPNVNTKYGVIDLNYSYHALDQARFKSITLPSQLNTDMAKVIEIETENNQVIKVLYRVNYDARFDILIALIPSRNFVKTAWLNSKFDKHSTLDRSKYNTVTVNERL